MSATGDDEPRLREVAYRLFATEFDDADFSYSESDEERAPNYVVTPTGARVNRLFAVGVLTEIESVNQEVLRARIADPTGAFVVYAGQYQPEALAFLESAEPPLFVAVTGKARTFEPEDSDRVYTSIRPETISEVDATTRDRWVVQAAEQTLERIGHLASAKRTGVVGDQLRESLEISGLTESQAAGVALALDHYGPTGDYLQALRETALDATRVVAGERDEARGVSMRPGDGTDDPLPTLAALDVEVTAPATSEPEPAEPDTEPAGAEPDAASSESTTTTEESGEAAASTPSESVEPATTEGTEPDSAGTADATSETAAESESTGTAAESEPTETAEASSTESAEASTPEPESTTTEVESSTATEAVDESPTGTVEEPSSEPSTETADEPSQTASETTPAQPDAGTESGDEDLGDFEPEFELDEDEREQIEAEYGTEFQSGTDVDDPGEADIETPDPEEVAAAAAETDVSADAATESAAAEPAASETASEPDDDDDAATEVDLEDAVMSAMKDLDDGGGADREELVASVVDQHGADPGAVEDAIQDALMGGRCYEPEDGKLTPI